MWWILTVIPLYWETKEKFDSGIQSESKQSRWNKTGRKQLKSCLAGSELHALIHWSHSSCNHWWRKKSRSSKQGFVYLSGRKHRDSLFPPRVWKVYTDPFSSRIMYSWLESGVYSFWSRSWLGERRNDTMKGKDVKAMKQSQEEDEHTRRDNVFYYCYSCQGSWSNWGPDPKSVNSRIRIRVEGMIRELQLILLTSLSFDVVMILLMPIMIPRMNQYLVLFPLSLSWVERMGLMTLFHSLLSIDLYSEIWFLFMRSILKGVVIFVSILNVSKVSLVKSKKPIFSITKCTKEYH